MRPERGIMVWWATAGRPHSMAHWILARQWIGAALLALSLAAWRAPAAAPLAAPHAAAVYYVSPAGDDANPGTADRPWRTISQAARTLAAGDAVWIGAGIYRERVIPQNSGSDAAHLITYAAQPGAAATLDGSGIPVPVDEGLMHIAGQAYILVSGLRIVHSAYSGILVDQSSHIVVAGNATYDTASSGIGVWGSRYITVTGNDVALACSNGMQESLTLAGTDGFEISRNHVHNGAAGYDKEGIGVKDGASNGRVYQNHVHDTTAVGIYVDAWDKHTSNIDVYQNVVHDAVSDGIALASEMGGLLEHIRVYDNIAYHNGTVGVWISACCSGAPAHPVRDVRIVNNTLYGNGWEPWGGGIAIDRNPDAQDIVIRNNLCSQNLSFQIAVDPVAPTQTLAVDHNLIDGYRGGEGETAGADPVVGDPRLVAPLQADFHLQPDSPAIDRGAPLDAPAMDCDGNARPLDGDRDGLAAWDIGACERAGPWRVYLPGAWLNP